MEAMGELGGVRSWGRGYKGAEGPGREQAQVQRPPCSVGPGAEKEPQPSLAQQPLPPSSPRLLTPGPTQPRSVSTATVFVFGALILVCTPTSECSSECVVRPISNSPSPACPSWAARPVPRSSLYTSSESSPHSPLPSAVPTSRLAHLAAPTTDPWADSTERRLSCHRGQADVGWGLAQLYLVLEQLFQSLGGPGQGPGLCPAPEAPGQCARAQTHTSPAPLLPRGSPEAEESTRLNSLSPWLQGPVLWDSSSGRSPHLGNVEPSQWGTPALPEVLLQPSPSVWPGQRRGSHCSCRLCAHPELSAVLMPFPRRECQVHISSNRSPPLLVPLPNASHRAQKKLDATLAEWPLAQAPTQAGCSPKARLPGLLGLSVGPRALRFLPGVSGSQSVLLEAWPRQSPRVFESQAS